MVVKTRPRLQSNILLACLAGSDLIVGAASQPAFIAGQIYVIKGVSLIEYCRYYNDSHLIYVIPILASLYHLTLISIERFVGIKYTFRYVTIVTGLRLKIAVVGSWITACLPLILQSFFVEFKIIIKDAASLLSLLNLSLILNCHLSVYFVTRRHEKQIKCQQVSPQAAADFAREKNALKTTRMIIMALLVCFFPLFVHTLLLNVYFKSSSYILKIIVCVIPFSYRFSSLTPCAIRSYTAIEIRRFERHVKSLLK